MCLPGWRIRRIRAPSPLAQICSAEDRERDTRNRAKMPYRTSDGAGSLEASGATHWILTGNKRPRPDEKARGMKRSAP